MIFLLSLIFVMFLNNFSESLQECGSFATAIQAVLNGDDAHRGEFPFLFPLVERNNTLMPFCSGNLISKNIALTGENIMRFYIFFLSTKLVFSCTLHIRQR